MTKASCVNSQVSQLTIPADRSGQRLDNFLFNQLKGVPKSHVYRILRTGQVRVNKKRAKPQYKLQVDDVVRVPPLRLDSDPTAKPSAKLQSLAQDLLNNPLYEDEFCIALNKPAGIAVHGGSGIQSGLIEAINSLQHELYLVHRLDRATSGCLLLAKTRHSLQALSALWRERAVTKEYTAVLVGHLAAAISVDTPLQKGRLSSGERMVSPALDGKLATTHIKPVRWLEQTTLVDISISTGRMHQIRVHCASIGHPVLGDSKYGAKQLNQSGVPNRLCLHASRLRFFWQQAYDINAPLPPELLI